MRKWLPLLAACLGTLMLLIDVTIVNVALPDIAADLGAGLSGLQWVIDGYALALAALLLVLGSLADRIGAKRAYLAGLAVFAVASLACGLACSAAVLVGARVAQGVGGAAMFATTLSLLNASYVGRDRGTAFGVWGAVSGAAAGIGVVEARVLAPMLQPAPLRNRVFGATLFGAAGQTFAAFAATPLLWLQQQLHLSPLHAGLAMLPMAATAFVVAGAFGRLAHDAPAHCTIGAGLVLIGVGAGLLTLIGAGSSWTALLPGFVVIGAGVGVNAPALVSAGMAAVPPHQGGTAAGAVNTARQLGLALGVAILGTVFRGVAGADAPITVPRFVDGLDAACAVASGVGIGFGLIAFVLLYRRRGAGAEQPSVTSPVPVS